MKEDFGSCSLQMSSVEMYFLQGLKCTTGSNYTVGILPTLFINGIIYIVKDHKTLKIYDVVVATPFSESNYSYFSHEMAQSCGRWRLSFAMVDDTWIHEFYTKLVSKEICIRVLFDFTANQAFEKDIYSKFAREVKKQGGAVIDDPEVTARAAHKGLFHDVLVKNKVPVPETVVVKREDIRNFKITAEIKKNLGVPFVVKPAWGDSGVGVVVDGRSEADLRKSAKETPNSDSFLLQQRLSTKRLGSHSGWFRIFYIFGDVIACWWDPESHEYHLVKPVEIKQFKLSKIYSIVKRIAHLSMMNKFSCELCVHEDGKLYAVDYVNADFDLNPQSFYVNGVPDEVVRHITWLLYQNAALIVKKGQGYFDSDLNQATSGSSWLENRQRTIQKEKISR